MLVGGYSVILHGHNRTTGDMDIWVAKTFDNYKRLVNAFAQFGMPVFDMTEENFLINPAFNLFVFGKPPVSIEILTNVTGLDFENTYANSEWRAVEGLQIRLISFDDLLKAKKSVGRNKDMDDIENLT
jgi:hypothetical protein